MIVRHSQLTAAKPSICLGRKPRSNRARISPCGLTVHDGSSQELVVTCRIDTANEVQYFQSGGILNYVLRNLMK